MLLIPLYLVFMISMFFQRQFSNPQVIGFTDAVLVGILVIITLYYSLKVSEQNKMIRKQNNRSFVYDIIRGVLNPLKDDLLEISAVLYLPLFDFSDFRGSPTVRKEYRPFSQYETLYVAELKRIFPKEMDDLDAFFAELEVLEENINELMKETWTDELSENLQMEIIKRGGEYKKTEALNWILTKLVLTEKEFEYYYSWDKTKNIWKTLLKGNSIAFPQTAQERTEMICEELKRLSNVAIELHEELKSITLQLAKEYDISLR